MCGRKEPSAFLGKIITADLMKSQIYIQYNSPW